MNLRQILCRMHRLQTVHIQLVAPGFYSYQPYMYIMFKYLLATLYNSFLFNIFTLVKIST